MPSIKPYWIAADSEALQLPGTNTTLGTLVSQAGTAVNAVFAPVAVLAAKSTSVNARLKAWYDQKLATDTSSIDAFTGAAANFLQESFATGSYVYLPFPDVGGFPYLRQSLAAALGDANDPNRPEFADTQSMGGVLLMLAGSRAQVFAFVAALAFLFGGHPDTALDALGTALIESPALQGVADAFSDMASKDASLWTREQTELHNAFTHSTFGKLVTGGFPAALFPQAPVTVTPPTPRTPTALDALANAAGGKVFGSWKALSVGAAVNSMFPGAAEVANNAIALLDGVGALASDTGNAVTKGLDVVGALATGLTSNLAAATSGLGDLTSGFLTELTEISASTMIIPPSAGGMHELSWALSQGLDVNALNAPYVDDAAVTGAIFIVSGAATGAEVVAALKKFGTLLGVPSLASL